MTERLSQLESERDNYSQYINDLKSFWVEVIPSDQNQREEEFQENEGKETKGLDPDALAAMAKEQRIKAKGEKVRKYIEFCQNAKKSFLMRKMKILE